MTVKFYWEDIKQYTKEKKLETYSAFGVTVEYQGG